MHHCITLKSYQFYQIKCQEKQVLYHSFRNINLAFKVVLVWFKKWILVSLTNKNFFSEKVETMGCNKYFMYFHALASMNNKLRLNTIWYIPNIPKDYLSGKNEGSYGRNLLGFQCFNKNAKYLFACKLPWWPHSYSPILPKDWLSSTN